MLCPVCGKPGKRLVSGSCRKCYETRYRTENRERIRARLRAAHLKHKEERNAKSRAYYAANKERMREQQRIRDQARLAEKREYNRLYQVQYRDPEYQRRYKLRTKYSMTLEQFDAMVAAQQGLCAICRKEETARSRDGERRLKIDHSHATGARRGLLCHGCNTALGRVEDADWLAKALAYLEQHRPRK